MDKHSHNHSHNHHKPNTNIIPLLPSSTNFIYNHKPKENTTRSLPLPSYNNKSNTYRYNISSSLYNTPSLINYDNTKKVYMIMNIYME